MGWSACNSRVVLAGMVIVGVFAGGVTGCVAEREVRVTPREDESAVLRNPDMGWVLLENYPLDQEPDGTSTLATLPDDTFPELDYAALMFAWSDVETAEGVYDFTRVNFAYDYWRARGKRMLLRMGAESFLWWPGSGRGAPGYVLDRLPPEQKQNRRAMGCDYVVVDARNAYYRDRLGRFLQAVDENFPEDRPVELIDLRGFGLWGEWHSGFQYPSLEERREALCGIIDLFSEAFPRRSLALSYSYDPDSPPELWSGTTAKYDPSETGHYGDYVRFSAFDHALTKPNVTFRRDGCGGTVHSNERKFAEEAFARRHKGPFTSEFFDGYRFFNGGDPWWNADRALADALSLHPNFIVVMGWQALEARQFVQERPDLVSLGLRKMGYRLVPTGVSWPARVQPNQPFALRTEWVNRGVGRATVDYSLEVILKDAASNVVFDAEVGGLGTSNWVKGEVYRELHEIPAIQRAAGTYALSIAVLDPRTATRVQLPLADGDAQAYPIGTLTVEDDK